MNAKIVNDIHDIVEKIEQGNEYEDIDTSEINTIIDLRNLINVIEKDVDSVLNILKGELRTRSENLERQGYCSECGGAAEYVTVSKGYAYLDGVAYRDIGGDTVKCYCSECGKEIS